MYLGVGNYALRCFVAASLFLVLIQFYYLFAYSMYDLKASAMRMILVHSRSIVAGLNETIVPKDERCAIILFGLPRAFESLVLPSIEKNVIKPNAAYRCDYFIEYFNLTEEVAGRSSAGGHINPDEIFLLKQAVLKASTDSSSQREQTVAFVSDTEEDFLKQYTPLLDKIRTVKDSDGHFLYFPWKARTYTFTQTTDNIIKMWHNIQHGWQLMETYEAKLNVEYTRVAMLRNDVVYMTPIDIFQSRYGTNDTAKSFAVVPGFAKYPVNDRMIYGPYKAVKIWATERFSRLDDHVQSMLRDKPGFGMHSESFLNYTIFPAIRATNTTIEEHDSLCFFRARADETVWISDCKLPGGRSREKSVERILGRKCWGRKSLRRMKVLNCTQQQ